MTCIHRPLPVDPYTVSPVCDQLDSHVAPHLAFDVTSYPRGHQRA